MAFKLDYSKNNEGNSKLGKRSYIHHGLLAHLSYSSTELSGSIVVWLPWRIHNIDTSSKTTWPILTELSWKVPSQICEFFWFPCGTLVSIATKRKKMLSFFSSESTGSVCINVHCVTLCRNYVWLPGAWLIFLYFFHWKLQKFSSRN